MRQLRCIGALIALAATGCLEPPTTNIVFDAAIPDARRPPPDAEPLPDVAPGTPDAEPCIPDVPANLSLLDWLQAREYDCFAIESAPNAGDGFPVHFAPGVGSLDVEKRVSFNPILNASMAQASEDHPVGAASIKEFYNTDGDLVGWAAMVKIAPGGNDPNNWYWFQAAGTDDGAQVQAGVGVTMCGSCHIGSPPNAFDLIQTPHPLI